MSKEPGELLFESMCARAGWIETWCEVEDKQDVAAVESAIRADERAKMQAGVDRLREALKGVIRIADRDCPEFRAARDALEEHKP